MKKFLALFLLIPSLAWAQPSGGGGPGPVPSPWIQDGAKLSYGGCVLIPASVTGGCPGNGTINAQAVYVNGVAVTGAGITALTGDVTATGPGSVASTVAKIRGTTVSGTTGSGNVVFSISPTFTGSPVLSTPSASSIAVAGCSLAGSVFCSGGTALVSANAATLPTALTGTMLRVGQLDGTISRVEIDSYGTATPSILSMAHGRGTAASPTAVQSGDELGSINSWGYIGLATLSATAVSAFRTYAAENFSSGHQGSKSCIGSTPLSSTTLTDGLCQISGVTIGSPTGGDEGAGTLNATNLYVNGVAVSTSASTLTVGTSPILSGTTTRILYDNAGVLGEYTLTGSGTVVAMQTSPTFVTGITTPIANLSGSSNQLVFQSGGVTGTFSWTPSSTNKTITLPNGTTDFTSTGGTGQFVKQAASGAALTVSAPTIGEIAGLGTGVATALAVNVGSTGAFARNIAAGATTLSTSAISSGTCGSVQTVTATGTLSTDTIGVTTNADISAVTGYTASITGGLNVRWYPTADAVNFLQCNSTTGSITPGPITINWKVTR